MKKVKFKHVYLGYLVLLIVAASAAIIYVNVLLHRYEELRPEVRVEEAVTELCTAASQGSFWDTYSMPEVLTGEWEEGLNVQEEYMSLYCKEQLKYAAKSGMHAEDELLYVVKNGDRELAEIKLKAMGPAETKLAVFSFREWQVASVTPILEAKDYTIAVPSDFSVWVNNIPLTLAEAEESDTGEMMYQLKGLYQEPVIQIKDRLGRPANFEVRDGRVTVEFYVYSLTLPAALSVEVNGAVYEGTSVGRNRIRYDIYEVEKPVVTIGDYYGNHLNYEGGNELPLTFATITADSRYTVSVEGQPVPQEAIVTAPNKEFAVLEEYVKELPEVCTYDIAILKENALFTVFDQNGQEVVLAENTADYDLLDDVKGTETVPEEILAEVDLLEIAHNWSLFMSNDLAFSEISQYMIKDSYQYQVAKKYATGVDITYTSAHGFANPPFTEDLVTNFQWITKDCFSVDISFIKNMILTVGTRVNDPMNDRFYFVRYDTTEDGKDNPTWKMVSMKEIVNNEK